jgi:hypothetical protein
MLGNYGQMLSGVGNLGEAAAQRMQANSPFGRSEPLAAVVRFITQPFNDSGQAFTDWSQGFAPIQSTGNPTQPLVNQQQLVNVAQGAMPAFRFARAVPGAVRDAAADFAEGSAMSGSPMVAFHGTPHVFPPTENNPLGAFDLSKIGTGEGAQAYGHGIYVAESPGTARYYMNSNEVPSRLLLDGQEVKGAQYRSGTPQEVGLNAMVSPSGARKTTPQQAAAELRAYVARGETAGEDPNLWLQGADWLEKNAHRIETTSPSFYHVDIPDEHIDKMLDWDKPLSEQGEGVQNAVAQAYKQQTGRDVQWRPGTTGAQAYNALSGGASGMHGYEQYARAASQALNRAGIPGLKYLDAGSRASGEGSRNFVLFDPSIAKITGRE